jgi:AcrR family transcriptional regulator
VVKRKYDASGRREQARRTRRTILAAAGDLFVEKGYAATRLSDIAARAGVSVPSVHAQFGTKGGLLSALIDVSIAGDDEPVPLPQREFVADIQALPRARAKLERYAEHLAEVHRRTAPVVLALASAATADPDAAAVRQKNDRERRLGMGGFAAELVGTGETRSDLTADDVADALWLAMDVVNWDWLVRRRGWSEEAFRRWYVDSVAGAVLA